MKILSALTALSLAGCQTTGYQDYANAMARIAEAQATVQREQAQALMSLAHSGDQTSRTVAIIMLAMAGGGYGGQKYQQPAPPQNEALQWAQVILPTAATIGLGWWGYKLGKTQSNNAADVSIAGYGAMNGIANSGFDAVKSFKPMPIDWTTFPVTNSTNIDIDNRDGQVVIGGNGVQTPAVIPPVVVVPPVVVTNP